MLIRNEKTTILLLSMLLLCCTVYLPAHGEILTLHGAFENSLKVLPAENPPVEVSSSASFFSGHIGLSEETGGGIRLEQSAFGQMCAFNIGYPGFLEEALNTALGMLYVENATTPEDKENAAFIYKNHLYNRASGAIEAQFSNIADLWDETRRQRAMDALAILQDAFKYDPLNRTFRWALLDIYYDIATADIAIAKEKMVQANMQSLGLVATPPGEFLITKEIDLMEEALELYRFAVSGYFNLLKDSMGIASSPYNEEAVPFGYYLFKTEVPNRPLLSPLMKDAEGNWVLPTEASGDDNEVQLFSGYKDIVLIFNVERDYAAAAAELARRYIMRGMLATETSPSDLDKAAALIGAVQQQSYLEYALFVEMFPEISEDMNAVDADSGMLEAVNSWRARVSELAYQQSYLNGESNLLGFTDDFLVLVQSQIPGNPGVSYFDSYDFFAEYLDPNSLMADRPLRKALQDLETARTEYANYRDRSDQLFTEFTDRNSSFNTRLLEIVGVSYDHPDYVRPFNNPAGLIYQQYKSVEMAQKRIEANRMEIQNINRQIEIEMWRRGEEERINDAIREVYIDYGDRQAELTELIGEINAEQAYQNNIADMIASTSGSLGYPGGVGMTITGGLVSYGINANIQKDLENLKAGLEAEKEKMAALERAEVKALDDALLDVNSQAQIKTWLLRMCTLEVESLEATLSLAQEWGRVLGLLTEKEALERSKAECNGALTDRYFADPIHRSLKDKSIIRAEYSFLYAQRWMYFAVRALEYKWNQPFAQFYSPSQCIFTADTLLQIRNAEELEDMYNAMAAWDIQQTLSGRSDNGYKKFSIRQDFLGYEGALGELNCTDPITGEWTTPEGAFRSYLKQDEVQLMGNDPTNPLRGINAIKLSFSTVIGDPAANFFSRNRWNEKIKWMRIKVYGAHIDGTESFVEGYLTYGGTSFIRNATEGYVDPQNSDRIIDEMRAYDSRYWYYDNQLAQWRFKEAFGTSIPSIQVSNDPDVPLEVTQIDLFKEKSVATSEWTLYLPVSTTNGVPIMNMNAITDIEIHFYYYWYARN
jgi:hypothetical protein